MKVVGTRFSDRLEKACEKKNRINTQDFGLNNWKDRVVNRDREDHRKMRYIGKEAVRQKETMRSALAM